MGLFDGIVGSVVGGLFGMAGASQQAASAKEQTILAAKLQRANWEYAQKNAHQFEIEDLRNAGLNPILSANHSQLASMPSVSIGSGASGYGQLGSIMAHAVTSGLQLRNDNERIKLEQAKVDLDKSRLELDQQQSAKKIDLYEKEIDKIDADIAVNFERLELDRRLNSASVEERLAAAGELRARTGQAIASTDLTNLEKKKLEMQMQYGTVLASYLPLNAREYIYNNLMTWIDNHPEEIDEFKGVIKKAIVYDRDGRGKDFISNWLESKGLMRHYDFSVSGKE